MQPYCKMCGDWMLKAVKVKGEEHLQCLGCGHKWPVSKGQYVRVKLYENKLKKEENALDLHDRES